MAWPNEAWHINVRLTPRRRAAGEACAVVIALDGHFSPFAVDVMDVSTGVAGILIHHGVHLAVGK